MNFLTDVLYEFQSTLLQEERHVGNGYMYWISKISIHAPTRGATHGPCECLQLYPYFNPRSYKRSDYYDVVVDRDVDLFQSTLLQEERRNLELLKQIRLDDFNPRSYKRSDNCNTSHFMRNIQFQSTLLQEERLTSFERNWEALRISIHAPTRGATVIILKDLVMYQFQSTLLQEERHSQMYFLYSGMNFNPRSYKRSDSFSNSFSMLLFISIHAPTRGATNQAWIRAFGNSYFNPRSYKRSDPAACPLCCIPDIFQSTLLQEERPFLGIFAPDCCQFQSTLLQEERQGQTSMFALIFLFQSTLLQEERPRWMSRVSPRINFNPRSYKRSDPVFPDVLIWRPEFQSTLLQEERLE